MALTVGELVGLVDLDTSGVDMGMSKVRRDMERLGNEMARELESAGRSTRAIMNKAGVEAGAGLKQGMESSGFTAWLGGWIKRATVGMGLLAGAGGVVGLKTAAGMEQAKIAFTTMLGSAQKADRFLRKLSDFAASTPFEFPELQTAASSLISAGVKANQVIPIMTTLGNVTSGMGTGSEGIQRATVALQQMQAAGKITGEDLAQLRDAGIPVYDLLASATGKSKDQVVALAQAGKLGKTELGQMMKALQSGKGMEKFSGLMAKQSKSLSGMWSSFTDSLNMSLASAMEPLVPMMKDGLGRAAEAVAVVLPKVAAALLVVANATADTVGWFKQHKTIAVTLAAVVGTLTAVTMAHSAAMAVSAAGGMAKWLLQTKLISAATKVWAAVQWALTAAMNANPLGIAVMAIAALVAAVTIAWKKSDTFRSIVIGAWNAIKSATVTAFGAVKDAVVKAFGFLKNVFLNFTGPGLIIKHWDKIKSVTTKVWGAVKSFVVGQVNMIKTGIGALASIPGKVSGWFGDMKDGAVRKLRALVTWVTGLPGKLLSALGDLGSILKDAGRQILNGLWNGLKEKWESVKGWLKERTKDFPKLKGPASKDKKLLRNNGRLIMQGLLDGLNDQLPNLKKLLRDVTKDLGKKRMAKVEEAVRKQYERGLKIAAQRADVASKLETATSALEAAIQLRDGFYDSVRDDTISFASLTGVADDGFTSAKDLVSSLQARYDAVVNFRDDMAQLLKNGLDDESYQDLLTAGVDRAGSIADALVQDDQSVAAIRELQGKIRDASEGLASDSSTHLYQAGVTMAQNTANGLLAQQAYLEGVATQVGLAMAQALSSALNTNVNIGGTTVKPQGKGPGKGGKSGKGKNDKGKKDKPAGREAPLVGAVYQQPGESGETLAERLWFMGLSRG